MKASSKYRVSLLGAASLLLVACGGGGTGDGSAADDANITIGTHLAPIVMDPHHLGQFQNSQFLLPVYDTLTEIDVNGEVQPMLAESWEYSEDGRTFTMALRDDVTFTDGEKFDASAAKANLDRLLSLADSPLKGFITSIESVEAPDETTLVINLNQSDAQIPALLGDREGMMISPKLLESDADLSAQGVGTGPYELVEFKPGEGVTYTRNDDYWGDVPKTEKLELRTIADGQARLNAVSTGGVDLAYITATQFDAAESAGLGVVEQPGLWFIHIYTNLGLAPLDDIEVRRAVATAIDRDAICSAIYMGHCEVMSSVFPPDYFGASEEVGPDYFEYDPAKAKKILTDAGYAPGDVSFEIIIPAGTDPYPAFSELLKAQLNDVGIELKIRPVDINQMTDIYAVQKDGQAMLGGGGQVHDPGLLLAQYFSADALYNPGGESPGDLAAEIEAVQTTVDTDERQTAIHTAVETVAEEAFNIPLVQPGMLFAYDKDTVESYEASKVALILLARNLEPKTD